MELLSHLAETTETPVQEPETSATAASGRHQIRLKADAIDELVAAYEAGSTVRELSSNFGIHRTTVMAHLQRRGVATRANTRKLTDERVQEAIGLYRSGLSLADVGEALGVNAEVVRRELIRAGVDRRGVGRPRTR